MTEDICYKRNYLTRVIARLDFPSPLQNIETQLPPEISKAAMRDFPIAEPREAVEQQVQFSRDELRSRRSEYTEWRFHGRDRAKTFTVGPSAAFAQYTRYSSYAALSSEFLSLVSVLFTIYDGLQGSRLGLRYINTIVLDEREPLAWDAYLNPLMLCLFKFNPHDGATSRIFHVLEFNFGDVNLRYQFGIHNPDFPAPIKRKMFVLDLDAYYRGPLDHQDIAPNLAAFHARIQELFEVSITDSLRELMNA